MDSRYYHQCDTCGTVNVDTQLVDVMHCVQTECGWHPEKTAAQNRKTAKRMRLLTPDEVAAHYHAHAPSGPADQPHLAWEKPQPVCTICQQPLPFPVHPAAPDGIDWRCSDACTLAQPA